VTDFNMTVKTGVIDSVVEETTKYGSWRLETGGFLFGDTGTYEISGVAMAGDMGITRQPDLFEISERALDRLFTYAGDQDIWLPVQFHSHELYSDMSLADERYGLNAEGFVSTILPSFANPPTDPSNWGWCQFEAGLWRRCASASVVPGKALTVVVFDEGGVRER
jgi:hypothetical protein